ncbi:hypothetical protein B4113_2822 [Geobacillus sp. B4113_201601]|nr:hypothetical protein B4113_2822 [Geobacillus sp. B4113_201601]
MKNEVGKRPARLKQRSPRRLVKNIGFLWSMKKVCTVVRLFYLKNDAGKRLRE